MDGLSTGPRRRSVPLEVFLEYAASQLKCTVEELAGTTRETRVVEALETIALLGVERYGFFGKAIAKTLNKHPGTASRWIGRALRRKAANKKYRTSIDKRNRKIADLLDGPKA